MGSPSRRTSSRIVGSMPGLRLGSQASQKLLPTTISTTRARGIACGASCAAGSMGEVPGALITSSVPSSLTMRSTRVRGIVRRPKSVCTVKLRLAVRIRLPVTRSPLVSTNTSAGDGPAPSTSATTTPAATAHAFFMTTLLADPRSAPPEDLLEQPGVGRGRGLQLGGLHQRLLVLGLHLQHPPEHGQGPALE